MSTDRECVYTEDGEGGAWECSACNAVWCFTDDGPQENGMRYCPHCGAKITDVKPFVWEDDDE